ncbi:unnamed protein product [Auanema sp. JU1783]|nr:unnamed protein product [Auanema sp. JU1783]
MINLQALDMETLFGCLVAIIVFMGTSILYLKKKERERKELSITDPDGNVVDSQAEEEEEESNSKNGKKKSFRNDFKKKLGTYEHPWIVTTLKGHLGYVTYVDFSQDGKKFVSVSTDSSILIWKPSDFHQKEHKVIRQPLEFDTATKVVCSPDSKSIVCSVKRDNKLVVFKLARKDDGSSVRIVKADVDFPKSHQLDISALGISSTGKFLMTASTDMKINLYNIRGEVLKVIEPKVSSLFDCCISPDGRFVAIAGFTPDVFPKFDREGRFVDCKKAFDLKGHNSGVYGVAFNQDSSRAATVSRDGHWRVFDTNIRYAQGQDASILRKGYWAPLKGSSPDNVRIAFSPSGLSVAVSSGSDIKFFSAEDENKDFPEMKEVHTTNVAVLRFSPCGKYLASCGDKYVRIFKNAAEPFSLASKLKKNIGEASGDAQRRRIQEQIDQAEEEAETLEIRA